MMTISKSYKALIFIAFSALSLIQITKENETLAANKPIGLRNLETYGKVTLTLGITGTANIISLPTERSNRKLGIQINTRKQNKSNNSDRR